jgi:hypothetical protein
VAGDHDPVCAEGVRGPDHAADVARVGRAVERDGEEVGTYRDPPRVVWRHLDDRHELRRAFGLLAQFGQQAARHRHPLGLDAAQHVLRPRGQPALAVVYQGPECPAVLGRKRDRPHALDQELPRLLPLGPVAEQ